MADSSIGITEGSGSKLDAEQLTVSSTTVKRERVQVAGTTAAAIQAVTNADPAATAYGSAVRLIGQVAHDSADAGSPVKVGGKASVSEDTSPVNADRVDAWFATNGALFTHPLPVIHQRVRMVGAAGSLAVSRATSTSLSTTAVSLISSPGAGNYTYVIGVISAQTGAAFLTIETAVGPTTLWQISGGQNTFAQTFAPPGLYLFRSNANEAINLKWSVAPTNAFLTVYYVVSSVNL